MTTSTTAATGPGRWPGPRDLVASPLRGFVMLCVALAGLALVGSLLAVATYAAMYWLEYARSDSLVRSVALLAGLAVVVAVGLPPVLLRVRGLANLTRYGAQARLVALGMTLGALEEVLDKDEEKARALLLEAQSNSSKALAELRVLVRGIHPPVLADRGLVDAVRALALDNPLPVEVTSDLSARPPAPVESAVYFGVSELLANVSKYAGATKAWVKLRHVDGALVAWLADDGRGGANPDQGRASTGSSTAWPRSTAG